MLNTTLTSVSGFRVGHYTDLKNMTGCTVILCPPKTVASCEVRGNSPGSREIALLAPEKTMQEVHAVLLTGGSAFGLAAADGVVKWLSEHDVGYKTPWVKVPIVPTAVVFDLNVGDSHTRPGPLEGYEACRSATKKPVEEGNVGAGTGTTVGKWAGMETWMKGGVGTASHGEGEIRIAALAVVNAVGDILGKDGRILAGARDKQGIFLADRNPVRIFKREKLIETTNTTLVLMATNVQLTKLDLFKICQRMHDGMARAVAPVHTGYDGDATFALSSGTIQYGMEFVSEISADLTTQAIRRAVMAAKSVAGIPGLAS